MMTLRYERDPDRIEGERTEPHPALLFPLESTVVSFSAGGLERRLDRAVFALVPACMPYSLEVHSAVAPTLTLGVGLRARDAAQQEYRAELSPATWDRVVEAPRVFARTRWVDELANRYLFERHVGRKHQSAAARFLETELTKEVFFIGREQLGKASRASQLEQPTDLVRTAQAYVESHLFEPLTLRELARACYASESTLLRAFHRELGFPPTAYLRNRRLDEALLLLESRKYTASEVAVRIGYASLSAFSVAFSRRFATPPSRVQARRAGAALLPPQGALRSRRRAQLDV